jgi:hypothetical protein
LRYRNVIDLSALGIECDWTNLITPHILGELATDGIGSQIFSQSVPAAQSDFDNMQFSAT